MLFTNHMDDARSVCPVPNCGYTGPIASVAAHISGMRDSEHDWTKLGYGGANDFKRKYQNDTSDSPKTTIAWLTDSHLGTKYWEYSNRKWKINPLGDLSGVLDLLDKTSIDTIVHTGDFFHRVEVEKSDLESTQSLFKSFPLSIYPLHYIFGNHDRDDAKHCLKELEKHGLANRLYCTPYQIDDVALYGISHRGTDWWNESTMRLEPSTASYRVLCLHQAVKPISKSDGSLNPEKILPKLSQKMERPPDVVLLGHTHRVGECTLTIDGHEVRIIAGGATTRAGKRKDTFEPGAGIIRFTPNAIDYKRVELNSN